VDVSSIQLSVKSLFMLYLALGHRTPSVPNDRHHADTDTTNPHQSSSNQSSSDDTQRHLLLQATARKGERADVFCARVLSVLYHPAEAQRHVVVVCAASLVERTHSLRGLLRFTFVTSQCSLPCDKIVNFHVCASSFLTLTCDDEAEHPRCYSLYHRILS
jgi:hypothetical protein